MAGEGRMLFIEGKWVDSASPEFQKSMKKMKGAAQKQGKEIGGLVNEKMGRAMSQFNEKTEKGRQLLTTFGGVLGGAAGNVVYYAGTLSYVVGRFSFLEMGIMGAVAALGAMTYALITETAEEKEAAKAAADHAKKMGELATKLEEAQMAAAGMTSIEIKFEKAYQTWEALVVLYGAARKEEARLFQIYQDSAAYTGSKEKWEQAKAHRVYLEQKMKEAEVEATIAQVAKDAAYEAKRAAEGKGKKGGKGGKVKTEAEEYHDDWADWWEKTEEDGWRFLQRKHAQEVMEEERHAAELLALRKMVEDKKQRIAEESMHVQMDIERQRVDKMHETLRNGIQLFGQLGELVTKGTKAQSAARIAAIVIEAAYQAAMETAAGFASLANPWLAAAHFTAAGLYAAVAAGKVAGEAGGGGGGGGASVGARESAQGGWGSREPEKSEGITIIIQPGVLTGSEAGKEIADVLEQHYDSWSPGRVRKGMG